MVFFCNKSMMDHHRLVQLLKKALELSEIFWSFHGCFGVDSISAFFSGKSKTIQVSSTKLKAMSMTSHSLIILGLFFSLPSTIALYLTTAREVYELPTPATSQKTDTGVTTDLSWQRRRVWHHRHHLRNVSKIQKLSPKIVPDSWSIELNHGSTDLLAGSRDPKHHRMGHTPAPRGDHRSILQKIPHGMQWMVHPSHTVPNSGVSSGIIGMGHWYMAWKLLNKLHFSQSPGSRHHYLHIFNSPSNGQISFWSSISICFDHELIHIC